MHGSLCSQYVDNIIPLSHAHQNRVEPGLTGPLNPGSTLLTRCKSGLRGRSQFSLTPIPSNFVPKWTAPAPHPVSSSLQIRSRQPSRLGLEKKQPCPAPYSNTWGRPAATWKMIKDWHVPSANGCSKGKYKQPCACSLQKAKAHHCLLTARYP